MQHPITLRDIESLKKLAKQAKSRYPDMSHAQRLDQVARESLQARHYHEVRQVLEQSLEQHYDRKEDGLVYCKLCRFTFVPAEASDAAEHERMHLKFESALAGLGLLPAAYASREALKQEAHAEMSSASSPEQELAAVEKLLRSWFDRSLEKAIQVGDWKQHPTFEVYAAMMSSTLEDGLRLSTDLFHSKYGHNPGKIPKGDSYWRSSIG